MVDKSILQLDFCDDEGQHWLLPLGHYRAFGFNAVFMAVSIDLVLQPLDMSCIQLPLLHLVKLESSDNLFPVFHSQLPLHTPLLAIPSTVITQSLSLLLLVHLVIPTSLTSCSTPILMSVLVSWSALNAWPHFLDLGTN
jgi:hypothetical protein